MNVGKCLVMSLLLIGFGNAWATKPLWNLVDVAVPANDDGSARTTEQVQEAIIAGCRYKGWMPKVDSDSQIRCSILVRARHFAEVTIPYSEKSYSILYESSRELDYDQERQRIHRNYNKWVDLLSAAIQQQFY